MTTLFMNLTLPEPRFTAGPTWANNINTAFTAVDSHDHTSSKGQRITPAGLNIDSDVDLGSFLLQNLGGVTFVGDSIANNTVGVLSGDLYFKDGSGNQVRVTKAGAVDQSASGGIGGDFTSTPSAFNYIDSTLSYIIEDSLATPANTSFNDITSEDLSVNNLSMTSTTITDSLTVQGEVVGFGIVPIGALVAFFDQASVPDGFVYCQGQTISDSESPMNGTTLPNLEGGVFLMGNSTAGSTGGTNSYTLSTSQLPSHNHTINHPHSNTLTLGNNTVASSTHVHNMAHTHEVMAFSPISDAYHTKTTIDIVNTTVSTADTKIIEGANNLTAGGVRHNLRSPTSFNSAVTIFTLGVVDAYTATSGNSATTDQPTGSNPLTTITLSGSVTSHSGSSGSVGSGASIDNRPNYIGTRYLIRIK